MRVREKASLGTFDVVYRVKPTIYFFKVIRRGVYVQKSVHSLLNVIRKEPCSLYRIHGTWGRSSRTSLIFCCLCKWVHNQFENFIPNLIHPFTIYNELVGSVGFTFHIPAVHNLFTLPYEYSTCVFEKIS